jgi:hypothetical protein
MADLRHTESALNIKFFTKMKQSKTATLILTNMKNYKSTRKLAF